MPNEQREILRSCFSTGIEAAISELNDDQIQQMLISPYLELQKKLASSLHLAA